ncbi:MAG: hypothetical protein ACOX7L_06375 [Dethiobacteria bacterium]
MIILAGNISKREVVEMRINWKQKLTSRKFWAAVIGFITEILVLFNVSDLTISHVVGLITAASILVAYIIGEGMVDAARVKSEALIHSSSLVPGQSPAPPPKD